MKLIAQKPCSFGGKKFYIGDEVPAEIVLNPKMQEKMGVLAFAPDGVSKDEPVAVILHAEEGDVELKLTHGGLQAIFDAMTGNAEKAASVIEEMTDTQALLMLHVADGRKTIKAAAEARAKAISTKESAGEQ